MNMARISSENRRISTIIRQNIVHECYLDIIKEIGDYAYLVPRLYIYEKIQKRTGLCTKTIAHILNHTEYSK